MNKYNDILNNIINFISINYGISEDRIFEYYSLERDFNIYGEDAVDLIINYGKEFNVDVKEFKVDHYFSHESSLHLIQRLFKLYPQKNFTVKNIIDGIIAVKLNEEIITCIIHKTHYKKILINEKRCYYCDCYDCRTT